MTRIISVVLLATLHGMLTAYAAAFQSMNNCRSNLYSSYYRQKPSVSTSSQLRYSSDEDGIHNWLQPKQTHTSLSDEDLHNRDGDDHLTTRHRDDIIEGENNNILDNWTNNANERRNQRLQSLQNFNRANAPQSSKSSMGDGKQTNDINTAQEINHANNNIPMSNHALDLPYNDLSQLQAIKSNAPAILLPSGPGTGKSHVLSLRIAYLLQRHLNRKHQSINGGGGVFRDDDEVHHVGTLDDCTPNSMVILSFTNKDAERLKERALDYLFPNAKNNNNKRQNHLVESELWRNETSQQLWAGTMHSFSLGVLHKYGSSSSSVRVLPSRAMRNHVALSLRTLLNSNDKNKPKGSKTRKLQTLHLQALDDVGHSRSLLHQNIVRCIDLWKEANLPLAHPEPPSLVQQKAEDESHRHEEYQRKETRVRKACMELAMRLGIPKSSALLALDVYPEYQARHAAAGTADPSDLAGMAYRLLVNQPKTLHLLRSKLKHIIVDEYQDMSVSQHALLRLVVRGIVNEDETTTTSSSVTRKKKKVEQRRRRKLPVLLEPGDHHKRKLKAVSHRTYSVPSLFCAGDSSQSIYGWRGGTPELTIHGFRRDYPQGVIAPLGTCYRLPNDIVEAAAMLLPMGLHGKDDSTWEEETSYDVSPAAAAKVASSVIGSSTNTSNKNADLISRRQSAEENVRLGNQLLLSKGMQRLDSTVLIHGLWDYREEARYIASTIRRRSKERRGALLSALNDLNGDDASSTPSKDEDMLDLTDVAVMVRSSNQLHAIKEALQDAGVPFVTGDSEDAHAIEAKNAHQSWLTQRRSKKAKTIQMKPAMVMTMHRSKGEEFDDIYLAGWTEGTFPHPDAVSSNRVHEERRLAYVALTRARQRAVITHSFMKRILHYGNDGRKKYVTSQVQPSRFLYELVPSKKAEDGYSNNINESSDDRSPSPDDNKGTVWNRSAGVKEYVAGQDLPNFFQKSYVQPKGYAAKRSELRQPTKSKRAPEAAATPVGKKSTLITTSKGTESISQKTPLEIVEDGLKDIIVYRKNGASKKYTPIFKQMMASFFQIKRGNALVFASGAKSKQSQNESIYALIEASPDDLEKKPLGKCTATQLGHYLAYLILKPGQSAAIQRQEVKLDGANQSHPLKSKTSIKESLDIIETALKDILVYRKKGASKHYSPIFKEMLATTFQLKRGHALVFASGATSKQTQNESIYALVEAQADQLEKKPLGRCTATQLGHYLAYLLLQEM